VIQVVHHVRGMVSIHTSTAIHYVSVRHLDTADMIITVTVCVACYISDACYQFIVVVECVIPVVHHVRGMLSIHTSTAIHYVSVRHLDTADTIITVTVPSHRFHYR